MSLGVLGMAFFSYPLFLFIGTAPSLRKILFTQCTLSIFAIAYAALISALLVELFPVNERYSGIAFGYSLGHAIFAGVNPIVVVILLQFLGFNSSPALCLVLSSFMWALALYKNNLSFIFQRKTLIQALNFS